MSFFLLLIVTLISAFIVGVNKMIDRGNYFRINPGATSVILGHSHPECAFNDSLIDNCKNMAQSAESYFYTYYKLKKIIENNHQVKTVYVEFTNNQLSKKMDDWIWENPYFSYTYPKYAAFINATDYMLLFSHHAVAVLNSVSLTVKKNFLFLAKNKKDYIKEMSWGGYLYLVKSTTDSVVNEMAKDVNKRQQVLLGTSTVNIVYLEKIIDLCRQNAVKIYLVRSPMHSQYTGVGNEPVFKKILATKFAGIEFLDFKDFPLANNEFADMEHLNYKGATIFSLFFNGLLKDGLLNKPDKQQVINNAMAVRIVTKAT